jgi:MFS family permease
MFVATGRLYMVAVALKSISAEMGWPRAVPSAAFSLQFLGGGLGGILMGWWLDRHGAAAPTVLSAIMIGVGAMLVAGVSSPWQLYVIYAIMMGMFGRSALNVLLMANVASWDVEGGRSGVGVVFSGQAVGGAVWPLIFQYSNESLGWRGTATWYGIAAIIMMLPLSLVFRRRYAAAAASFNGPKRAPSSRPARHPARTQIMLCAAVVGCCTAMSLPLAHIVAHASDLGHDEARGAEMLSVMLLGGAASAFFAVGPLAQRLGSLRALFAFSFVQMLSMALFSAVDGLLALYAVSLLFGVGYGGILPCYPVIVRLLLPSSRAGRSTGVVLLFGGIGMALGSYVGGVSYDLMDSYRPAFLICTAANLANLVFVADLMRRTGETPQASAA